MHKCGLALPDPSCTFFELPDASDVGNGTGSGPGDPSSTNCFSFAWSGCAKEGRPFKT